jgi:DNA-binding GntR family transcriptional regulator
MNHPGVPDVANRVSPKRRITADQLPDAKPLEQQRLASFAFEYLRSLLLDNLLVAGDCISAEEVASRLRISRYPVMEALKRMAADGFLQIVPQVGSIVAEPDLQEINDFYAIFGKIEGELAACAARRRQPDEIARLADISQRLEQFVTGKHSPDDRARAYRHMNREFHTQIHRMARSDVVARMSVQCWDRSDFYIATVRGSQIFADRIGHAQEEHKAIQDAIAQGDVRSARRATEAHLRETARIVSERRAAAEQA